MRRGSGGSRGRRGRSEYARTEEATVSRHHGDASAGASGETGRNQQTERQRDERVVVIGGVGGFGALIQEEQNQT